MRCILGLALVVLLTSACADGNGPASAIPSTGNNGPGATGSVQSIDTSSIGCTVTVASGNMNCEQPSRAVSPGLSLNVILGGPQGRYVQLASTATAYNSGTQALTSSVTVRNNMSQPMGTANGTTADPSGTRIFFSGGPTVTGGTGTVTVIPDGTDTFTATNQAYYQYNGVIGAGATTAPKTWTFTVPNTVTTFSFRVMVSTRLPDEATVFTWEASAPPAADAAIDFYDVAAARGQVWASGANSKIIHLTDAGWVDEGNALTGYGMPGPVYSIHMFTDGDIIGGIAVGGSGSGIRLYYNGVSWENHSSGSSTLLSAVGVGTPNSIWWACGLGGIVYRAEVANNFGRWTPDFTTKDIYSCTGTTTTDVWAAGADGFLAHFNGTAWTSSGYNSGTTQTITAVTRCFGPSGVAEMWLVGTNGVVRHATSPFTTFTEQASGTTQTLYAVEAASCTDVYAVGGGGTILHYNGANWSPQSSGTTQLLSGLTIRTKLDGTKDAWVVGSNGTILHGVR